MTDLNQPNPSSIQSGHTPILVTEEDKINFRELFDIVRSGKYIVFSIALLGLLVGVAYAVIASPVYQADGMVQVEKEKDGLLGGSLDQLSELIGSTPGEAPAEIAILKSRMVLGVVVDNLKLYIKAKPIYFPVIGQAIARRRGELASPAPAPFHLRSYAWGGESIQVQTLEMPESWYDQKFILTAKGGGLYSISNDEGKTILSGQVGDKATITTSDGIFSVLVQQLTAEPGTTFWLTRIALSSLLDALEERFTVVEQPRDSGVLSLKLEGSDAKSVVRLLNEIEDAYLNQNVERKSSQAEHSLEFLQKQLPELRGNVDQAQARLNAYQEKKGTINVDQETQLILNRIVDLETKRMEMVQDRNAALQRYTEKHPIITTLNEQIRGIEHEQDLVKKQVEALPSTQQEILGLMRDVDVDSQLYTALLNSSQELQITKAGTVGNVRIIDHGLVPLRPIRPNKKAAVALGFFIGACLGVTSLFGLRALLKGVDRPEEVERVLGLATYASIPYSRTQQTLMNEIRKGNGLGKILATMDGNDSAVEALRGLRTSLHFAMLEAVNNIVMFTGPVPALGKSFVTINLGAVLALSGKKVIVVDADLRRGQLHRYVGGEQKPGLSDYIAGTSDSKHLIKQTNIDGLDFISGGSRPPNPAEVLMSERFGELLRELSRCYDYVLVDTPPVLPVTDAAIVGRMAGTTLLVLKAAEHPMRAIEETVKRLRQAGIQTRGVIFNQVGAHVGSYGYGSYGYAYGYSSYGYQSETKK